MQNHQSTFQQPIETARQGGGARPTGRRQMLWLALLVAASVAFSLGFACAVPFAAFGAVAALTLNRRDAVLLIGAVWLANQLVGFTLLGYPWKASTFGWGVALGVVVVLAVLVAQSTARFVDGRGAIAVSVAVFVGAFIMYEGGLYVVAVGLLGGTEDFTSAIMARILEINVAAFAGLLVLNRLATAGGLAAKPVFRPTRLERPA